MPAPKGNKNAVGNKGGRITVYRNEYALLAYKIALLGATDAQLADIFDVSVQTINTWKKKHIEFFAALKRGKHLADSEIAQSLFQRAKGYSHADVDIKVFEGTIIKTDIIKHYPPDTTACIFWLKNRNKDNWRDKTESEVTFPKLGKELEDEIYSD